MTASATSESSAWLGLEGRVCVVTGGGSGIGAETARLFGQAGARVAVLDRHGEAATAVAADIARAGARAIGLLADVARVDTVTAAAAKVHSDLGPCRVLVNNAAVRHRDELVDIDLEAWNRVLAVNLTGALVCTQAFTPQMITAGKGGSIVHVASLIGQHPHAGSGAYSVSKAGMIMLSRVLAVELGHHGIRSNVVSPGHTRTPATEAAYADPETAAARERLIPLGRVGQPIDLAQVIAFLASDRSGFVNGEEVLVDGGFAHTLMNSVPRPANMFKEPNT
jgi:NAD(P)-dependent dehydrogenase (short-subunit alcohol dehydrogenase family)